MGPRRPDRSWTWHQCRCARSDRTGASLVPSSDVIDADGLNAFAGRPAASGRRYWRKRPAVITPHPGEFARLVGTPIEAVLEQRFDIGTHSPRSSRATVLLKGVPTVLTPPTDRVE